MGVTLLVDSVRKNHHLVTGELIAYFTERAFHKKISRQLCKEEGNLPNPHCLVSCAPQHGHLQPYRLVDCILHPPPHHINMAACHEYHFLP